MPKKFPKQTMSAFQLNTDETCGALMIFAEVAKKLIYQCITK